MDHLTVYDSRATFFLHKGNYNTGGNYDWSLGPELGTASAVYLEDSTFVTPTYSYYGPFINDCTDGASDVIRNNILGSNLVQSHDAIIIGQRGCRKVEFYDNTITINPGFGRPNSTSIVRGGAQVMFNNMITNTPDTAAFKLSLYRTIPENLGSNDPWDTLCGSSSGKAFLNSVTVPPSNCTSGDGCVNKDGAGTAGFPCRDQVGTAGNGIQTIVPALFWNNKVDGSFVEPSVISGGAYTEKGVVYCSNASADKPATCNGSAVTYTPFTYPHHLNTDGGSLPFPVSPTFTGGSMTGVMR
jgi:hypothetical protein